MSQPDSKNQTMKWRGITIVVCCAIPIAVFLFVGGGLGILLGRSNQQPTSNQSTGQSTPEQNPVNASLEKAANWQADNHVHGLTVNPDNPQVIYVATHNGLVKRSETGEWFWMEPEQKRSDYMGFTAHPNYSSRFYASGHPHTGGNLGFQVTDNMGQDWKQISMAGVDFHTMAVAPSNPNIFYGWPASGAQGFHASTDGGKTWTRPRMVGLGGVPFSLAVDPRNPEHVFATTRAGLYESTNSGNDWIVVPDTQDAPVVGLTLLKEGDNTVMYGYRILKSTPGLYRSVDGGKTWKKFGTGTQGVILYQAHAPSNSQVFYAVNENNAIFQSLDGGKTWKELS